MRGQGRVPGEADLQVPPQQGAGHKGHCRGQAGLQVPQPRESCHQNHQEESGQ